MHFNLIEIITSDRSFFPGLTELINHLFEMPKRCYTLYTVNNFIEIISRYPRASASTNRLIIVLDSLHHLHHHPPFNLIEIMNRPSKSEHSVDGMTWRRRSVI